MFDRYFLTKLLKKKAQGRVYLGAESSINNDDMFFTLFDINDKEKSYSISKIDGDVITIQTYIEVDASEERDVISKQIDLADLNRYKIEIIHHYKLWKLDYSSLWEAFYKSYFGYNKLRWYVQSNKDSKAYSYYDKHELLNILIANKEVVSNRVCFFKVKNIIYGSNSDYRTDYNHNADLIWKLSALKDSEDIDFEDKMLFLKNIVVSPKALNSLSDFQREQLRHRDSIRMSRTQQLLALLLFLSAAVNVYFTHFSSNA